MTIQNSLFRTATTGYSHWQFPNPRWFECWLSHSLCSDCSIKPRPRGKRWWHGLGWRGDGLFWLQRGGRGWGWAGAAVPAQQWKVYPSHRGAQGSVGGRPTEAPNPCSQRQGPQGSPGALQPFSAGSGVSPEWAGLQRLAESKAPGLTSPHFFSICSCFFSLLLQFRTLSPPSDQLSLFRCSSALTLGTPPP